MKLKTIISVLALVAVLSGSGSGYLYLRALKTSAAERADRQVDIHSMTLSNRIEAFLKENLLSAAVVAGLPEIAQMLQQPDAETADRANALLDHVHDSLRVEVCYLIDRSGLTVASSNRGTPDSFVGQDYGFRPYFTQAMAGRPTVYMAVGITSGKKGIYYSHPVLVPGEESPAGVLVLKESVAPLAEKLRDLDRGHHGVSLLVGPRGVIFLAGKPGWEGKTLWSLTEKSASDVADERQFGAGPWPWSGLSQVKAGVATDEGGMQYLFHRQRLDGFQGWESAFLVKLDEEIADAILPLKNAIKMVSLILFCLVGISVLFLHRQAVSDIRRRRAIQEALEERENRLRQILDGIQAGVMLISADTRQVVDVNPAAEVMTGYSKDQLMGAYCWQVMEISEDRQCPHLDLNQVLDNCERKLLRADGKRLPILKTVKPVQIEGRQHLLETFVDISELQAAQRTLEIEHRKLLKTEASLAKAQTIASIGNWEWDLVTDAIAWSEQFARIFGISGRPPSAELITELIHPDDRAAWQRTLKQAMVRDGRAEMECRGIQADGTVIWIRIEAEVSFAEDRTPAQVFGIVQNISERKEWEDTLKRRRDFLHTLMETIPNPMFHKNAEVRYTGCNAAFEAFLGKAREEIVGKTVYDLLPKEMADVFHEKDLEVLRDPGTQHFQGKLRRADGMLREVVVDKATLQGKEGETTGLIGIITDITELTEARKKAEEASRAKSEFLANMSHEIRTPMNGVIGMTDLALSTELSEEQRDYLETIRQSAENLMTIINSILDFSKIEAGRMELEKIDFHLRSTVEDAAELLSVQADKKGLELICDIRPEVPMHLIGDPAKLRQVLINLGGNAIKFTEAGEVVIRCSVAEQSAKGCLLHFSVSDTGVGIPEEKIDTIFESFRQADGSMTRRFGGTGLGLSISKNYAEMMGGRMWAESRPGSGSAFHFTVEFAPTRRKQSAAPPISLADLSGRRVLVADDNETNRKILKEMVSGWGMTCETRSGGKEAIRELEAAAAAGNPYDLLLLDLQMPEMDGFEVSRYLERHADLRKVPVILLTSAGRRGDASQCREFGVDAYLIKPVKKTDLLEAVRLILSRPASDGNFFRDELVTRHSLRDRRWGSGKQILLAEDDAINQKVAVNLLERSGHRVTVVSDGAEAVSRSQRRGFDLIFMDVQMPEMDGLAATRKIRTLEKGTGRRVPIVAMTAHAVKGDRERCLSAGMDDYLTKPIQAAKLEEMLRRWIETETDPKGGAGSVSRAEPGKPSKEDPAPDPIDLQGALEQLMGNRALLEELLQEFRGQLQVQLHAISAAVAENDAERLRQESHRLKGTAANLCAAPIAAVCLSLEKAAKEGEMQSAGALVSELKNRIRSYERFVDRRKFALNDEGLPHRPQHAGID